MVLLNEQRGPDAGKSPSRPRDVLRNGYLWARVHALAVASALGYRKSDDHNEPAERAGDGVYAADEFLLCEDAATGLAGSFIKLNYDDDQRALRDYGGRYPFSSNTTGDEAMNIGTFFKALVSLAESDGSQSLLPAVAAAATSLATNQGPINLALQALTLKQAALKTGAQIAQDEITMLDDVVLLQLQKAVSGAQVLTPAQAAAEAMGGVAMMPKPMPLMQPSSTSIPLST